MKLEDNWFGKVNVGIILFRLNSEMVLVFWYTVRGFQINSKWFDYDGVLGDFPGLINYLRIRFGCRLFENELISYSFKVTQFRICIHAELQESPIVLSVENFKIFLINLKWLEFLKFLSRLFLLFWKGWF